MKTLLQGWTDTGVRSRRAARRRAGEGAERPGDARRRGSEGRFDVAKRSTWPFSRRPGTRGAVHPFIPQGLIAPCRRTYRTVEQLPTDGRTCKPAHARHGGLRPLRLVPLDHIPDVAKRWIPRPPRRQGPEEDTGGPVGRGQAPAHPPISAPPGEGRGPYEARARAGSWMPARAGKPADRRAGTPSRRAGACRHARRKRPMSRLSGRAGTP